MAGVRENPLFRDRVEKPRVTMGISSPSLFRALRSTML